MHPTGDTFTIKGSDGEYDWKVKRPEKKNVHIDYIKSIQCYSKSDLLTKILFHQVPSDLPQNATFSFKIDYTDSKGVS